MARRERKVAHKFGCFTGSVFSQQFTWFKIVLSITSSNTTAAIYGVRCQLSLSFQKRGYVDFRYLQMVVNNFDMRDDTRLCCKYGKSRKIM